MKTISTELKQAIWSWNFLIRLLVIIVITYLCVTSKLKNEQYASVVEIWEESTYSHLFQIILMVCSVYAFSYVKEKEYGNCIYKINRIGIRAYANVKYIACFISSLFSYFLGSMICIIPALFVHPVSPNTIENYIGHPYYIILANNPFLFLLLLIIMRGTYYAFFSALALTTSIYFPNYYVALLAPMAWYHIIINLSGYFRLPTPIYLTALIHGRVAVGNMLVSAIYTILLPIGLSMLQVILFQIKLQRRMDCGN